MFAELSGKLSAHLSRWIRARVVWFAGERRSLDGGAVSALPWLVILGREHYEERRRVYGIRSWRGLRAVLQLEHGEDRTFIYSIGPYGDEGRVVRIFRLLPSALSVRQDVLFVLPESLLLASEVADGEVLRVSRDTIDYYLSRGCASQLRGGTIVNERLFALSAGMAESSPIRTLGLHELGVALERALLRLSAGDWWQAFVAHDRWVKDLPWKRMAVTTGWSLAIYLLFASAYLESANAWKQRQLSTLGTEVDQLVIKQREIDRATQELKGMNQLAAERLATHYLWGVLAEMWRSGGSLMGMQLDGNQLTLRGRAAQSKATDILAALSRLPQVRAARFDAAVRAEFDQEGFVIVLTLVDPAQS